MTVRLSEDKKLVQEIRKKLKENNSYCPCKIEKTDDTKCMCKEFREQENDEYHCGLYVKGNYRAVLVNYIEIIFLLESN